MLKTHNCGDLCATHAEQAQAVTLAGWVHRYRTHGGVLFVDLRDRSGIVQVTFRQDMAPDAFAVAEQVRNEWVIQVQGTVQRRPPGLENADLPTGEVEVVANAVAILNPSKTPPFYIDHEAGEAEGLRLKYRYLDLRRQRMQRNIILRHQTVKFIRDFLSERGFVEIETPILTKSTPEGARDYWYPAGCIPAPFTPCPSRRSCSSS